MCEACFKKIKDMEQAIQAKLKEAKQAAINYAENVFIYEESNGSLGILPESVARKANITAIQIVSNLC